MLKKPLTETIDNYSFRPIFGDMEPDPRSNLDRLAREGSPVAASLHLDIAARTDIGLERGHNEDSLLVTRFGCRGSTGPCAAQVDVNGPEEWVALGVCDGMGGAAAGEVASRSAVEVIDEVLAAGGPVAGPSDLGRRLVASVEEAARRIHAAATAQRELEGMGTTATVCALSGDALFVAQVGDSRAYLLRGGRLTQITRDQTLATLMMEQGQLTPEELPTFAFNHVILQALGTNPRVDVDLVRVTVRRGDVLLVCSDGLSGPVGDETIRRTLEEATSPAAAGEALIALANAAGGPDNVTCIVARIQGEALGAPVDVVVTLKGGGLEPEEPQRPITVAAAAPAPIIEHERESEGVAQRRSALGRVLAFLRGTR